MKMQRSFACRALLLTAFVLVLATGCTTLQYRDVQREFDAAVRVDNGQAVAMTPLTEEPGYDRVLAVLTPEFIGGLDERLQANAWLLRAYSQWRTDQLVEALKSAQQGENLPGLAAGSRDAVMLKMIPALVTDREIEIKWGGQGNPLDAEAYEKARENFETALNALRKAEEAIGPPTPESTSYYLYYQKWRILQNWRGAINSIHVGDEEADFDAQAEALEAAKAFLDGKTPRQAAESAKESIPQGHPLRDLIRAQGGGD